MLQFMNIIFNNYSNIPYIDKIEINPKTIMQNMQKVHNATFIMQ